jgi:hypothetical protein
VGVESTRIVMSTVASLQSAGHGSFEGQIKLPSRGIWRAACFAHHAQQRFLSNPADVKKRGPLFSSYSSNLTLLEAVAVD